MTFFSLNCLVLLCCWRYSFFSSQSFQYSFSTSLSWWATELVVLAPVSLGEALLQTRGTLSCMPVRREWTSHMWDFLEASHFPRPGLIDFHHIIVPFFWLRQHLLRIWVWFQKEHSNISQDLGHYLYPCSILFCLRACLLGFKVFVVCLLSLLIRFHLLLTLPRWRGKLMSSRSKQVPILVRRVFVCLWR